MNISENIVDELESLESVEEINESIGSFQKFLESLPEKLINFGIKFVVVIFIFLIGRYFISLARKILRKTLLLRNTEIGVMQFLDVLVKYILYFILFVMMASCFGFQTTSLVALLGSAGVTMALALQGSLSNFTGGILILLLKPFKVGDYIKEDNKDNEGTVTEIHLFYTKLKTIDEKTVVLPNGTLANTSLTNVNTSPLRRVIMNVGISYSSDIKKSKEILRQLINSNEKIVKGQAVDIFVDSLDESQVTLCIRFYVKNEDYFEVKWDMTENIKLAFDENKIEIPYNQLDLHIIKED